jgi:hypothetical protein
MKIKLLNSDYDKSLIDIKTEESFIHLKDFLLNE